MMRSMTASGNWAGCGVRSIELRFFPDVTFGNVQTSVGFFPSGLHFSLPLFCMGYFTSDPAPHRG